MFRRRKERTMIIKIGTAIGVIGFFLMCVGFLVAFCGKMLEEIM